MNTCFEFHDSVLASILQENTECVLEFRPAYVHRSKGTPGVDAGDGLWQELRISIGGAKIKRSSPALPASISEGMLVVGEIHMSNTAPTNFQEAKKKVWLKMVTKEMGAEIEIEGTSIDIRTIGEPAFADTFPGVPR